jgi:hypothetical protein
MPSIGKEAPNLDIAPLRTLWLGLIMMHLMKIAHPLGGMMEPFSCIEMAF